MGRYVDIKRKLLKEIEWLPANQKILSRPALSRKYHLSRATVDKALRELIQEGKLYAVKGSGTFVAPKGDESGVMHNGGVSNWGVVVPNIMHDTCPGLLRGIEDFAQQFNTNIVIGNTDNDPDKERDYLLRMAKSGVRGVIVVPSVFGRSDSESFNELARRDIPFVFCNRTLDVMGDTPLITSNDFYGGYIATKMLIEYGYHDIGFVSRYKYRTSENRFFGYMAALQEASMQPNRNIIGMSLGPEPEMVERSVLKMLEQKRRPDAFLCHNDEIAYIVYRAIERASLRISDDVGVVGYDNTSICETLEPKLTSVSFRSYEIGLQAAKVLQKMILGQLIAGQNVFLFQPEIVGRMSCLGPKN